MADNKVTFGLKNVHYAPYDEVGGQIIYDTPIPIPGAVELSIEPQGDMIQFFADDYLYYGAQNNQGYEATLTIALIPDHFLEACLGEQKDGATGVLTETSTSQGKPFALLFEFDGDQKAVRHVLYNCRANRPTVGSQTKNDSPEPQTSELTLVVSPRPTDGAVKSKTTADTDPTVYADWYAGVYAGTPVAVTGVTLLPASVNLTVGEVQQLAATVSPFDATNKAVVFSSDDEDVATVTSKGLVIAVGAGTCDITVTTVDGNYTDTSTITVTAP